MPPRKVEERKTRKALRKVRRALEASQAPDGETLSPWESEFARSVEKRLQTYGSAFRDGTKGPLDEPLSTRQAQKLSEIGRKARGKGRGLSRGAAAGGVEAKTRKPMKRGGKGFGRRRAPRTRNVEDD